MCYSCSNIVVISIHIHAFKKPSCVHGSIVSPVMFPPYSNHRQGYSVTSALAALGICVCMFVYVCLYRRMPCTPGSLLVMIVSSRSPLDFLRGPSSVSVQPLPQSFSTCSSLVSSVWQRISLWRKVERESDIEINRDVPWPSTFPLSSPPLHSLSLWTNYSLFHPFFTILWAFTFIEIHPFFMSLVE